jgi:hypothetical protein
MKQFQPEIIQKDNVFFFGQNRYPRNRGNPSSGRLFLLKNIDSRKKWGGRKLIEKIERRGANISHRTAVE